VIVEVHVSVVVHPDVLDHRPRIPRGPQQRHLFAYIICFYIIVTLGTIASPIGQQEVYVILKDLDTLRASQPEIVRRDGRLSRTGQAEDQHPFLFHDPVPIDPDPLAPRVQPQPSHLLTHHMHGKTQGGHLRLPIVVTSQDVGHPLAGQDQDLPLVPLGHHDRGHIGEVIVALGIEVLMEHVRQTGVATRHVEIGLNRKALRGTDPNRHPNELLPPEIAPDLLQKPQGVFVKLVEDLREGSAPRAHASHVERGTQIVRDPLPLGDAPQLLRGKIPQQAPAHGLLERVLYRQTLRVVLQHAPSPLAGLLHRPRTTTGHPPHQEGERPCFRSWRPPGPIDQGRGR